MAFGALRNIDWFAFFRRELSATQAGTTDIKFFGAGHSGDGTYTRFDTNETTDGLVPQGEDRVLERLGWYFQLQSDPASVRDFIVKVSNMALFTLEVNEYPVIKEYPISLFPAGVGFCAESQDTVTAGQDLWFQMGSADPRSMRPFTIPIELIHGTTYEVNVQFEDDLALTTGQTFALNCVFWGKRRTRNVA